MIITQLKSKSLELRKARNPIAASATFALAEIEKIGKNDGNRETTNDEAVKVIQKLVSTLEGNLSHKDTSEAREEIELFKSLLPQMVSDDDVIDFLDNLPDLSNKGAVMKALRAEYGPRVDMKRAGELLANFII